jgi:hypothetical protein
MTHPLTIHSPFQDVNELVEGLAPFFTGEHLVLRAPDDVPEGEWIRFEVLLVDGTPGLSGLGQHAGTNDNGEEFAAERFDIYLGELQFDEGASSEAWAQIAAAFEASQSGAEGEAAEAVEGDAAAAEAADGSAADADGGDAPVAEAAEAAPEEPSEEVAGAFSDTSEATNMVDLGALGVSLDAATADEPLADAEASAADVAAEDAIEEAAAESEAFDAFEAAEAVEEASPPVAATPVAATPVAAPAPARPAPDLAKPPAVVARPAPAPVARGPLTRPTLPASWTPTAEPPVARPSLGVFAWGDRGLPVPARPPRPAGEVGRIDPAPRPASA